MAVQLTCNVPFEVALYTQQVNVWPTVGRHILASYDTKSIIVYQAFSDSIADAAVRTNSFHSDDVIRSGYSTTRMSWIKTNFLWMMFRSGWASKPSQERILAIRITRVGFEEILLNASTRGLGSVRLQWDPDHGPIGDKEQERRAIQLGLRGEMLERFSREFIVKIDDVTDFVKEQKRHALIEPFDQLMVPMETIYSCSDDAAKAVNLDRLQ